MRKGPDYISSLPVICVGNLTAGGAGKTPLAIHIAERLGERGEQPAFLSRGHSGQIAGPHRVDLASDDAGAVGDEPLLLARHGLTIVARHRPDGARLIEDLGASVIIMDDGFQNPYLAKDLSIVVVDGAVGIGNGLVIPAGPLRAPLSAQLGVAHAVVISGARARQSPSISAIKAKFAGPLLACDAVPASGARKLVEMGGSWLAYAGIGRPDKFFETAKRLGLELAACRSFPDHHDFSEAQAAELLSSADRLGARLLTTQKDFARLAKAPGRRRELAERSQVLAIRVEMTEGAGKLDRLICAALARKRQSTHAT